MIGANLPLLLPRLLLLPLVVVVEGGGGVERGEGQENKNLRQDQRLPLICLSLLTDEGGALPYESSHFALGSNGTSHSLSIIIYLRI